MIGRGNEENIPASTEDDAAADSILACYLHNQVRRQPGFVYRLQAFSVGISGNDQPSAENTYNKQDKSNNTTNLPHPVFLHHFSMPRNKTKKYIVVPQSNVRLWRALSHSNHDGMRLLRLSSQPVVISRTCP